MTLIFKVWKTKETYSPLSGDFELWMRKQVKTLTAFLLAAQAHCLIRHYKHNRQWLIRSWNQQMISTHFNNCLIIKLKQSCERLPNILTNVTKKLYYIIITYCLITKRVECWCFYYDHVLLFRHSVISNAPQVSVMEYKRLEAEVNRLKKDLQVRIRLGHEWLVPIVDISFYHGANILYSNMGGLCNEQVMGS